MKVVREHENFMLGDLAPTGNFMMREGFNIIVVSSGDSDALFALSMSMPGYDDWKKIQLTN